MVLVMLRVSTKCTLEGWEQLQVPQLKEAAPIPCYLLVPPGISLHECHADCGLLQSRLYFQALAKLSPANLCATLSSNY